MAIETRDMQHIAKLARIHATEDELAALQVRLGNILNMVDQLQAVDTQGIEPLANPLEATQRLRADVVTEANCRDAMLALAPAAEQGLYLVPQVIDQVE